MFYDKKANVLDGDLNKFSTIDIDLQPYAKNMKFEDGIELQISHRAYCDSYPLLNLKGYLRIDAIDYKVLDIKDWEDYMEVLLYKMEV